MLDAAQGADFATKALPNALEGARVALAQHLLDGHLPPHRRLGGPVHHAHAAAAQLADQLVLAERRPRRPGRRRRLVGLGPRLPRGNLAGIDRRQAEDFRQQPAPLAARVAAVVGAVGGVAEVLGAALAAARVEEQHLARLRVVQEQRVQRPAAFAPFEVDALAVGEFVGRFARQLQRRQPAAALADQLGAVHQPQAAGQPHRIDVDQSAAGEQVHAAQHLGRAGQQRRRHPLVEGGFRLSDGAVAQLAVAVADQSIRQVRHGDGGAGAGLLLQVLPQQGVEPGGGGQVVARPAQEKVAQPGKGGITPSGQRRQQQAHELAPVAQRGTGQVLQALGDGRVGGVPRRVLDDRRRGRKLQRRFPQVEGGEVALQGEGCFVSAAVELRQRQR